jgi:hypothetical protein
MDNNESIAYGYSCITKHKIYPDFCYNDDYEETEEGEHVSYFYLHGQLQEDACYDICNVNLKLMHKLFRPGVYIAGAIFGEEVIPCLVFSYFDNRQMRGLIMKLDDLESIKSFAQERPDIFVPCGGHTPDAYLKEKYNEVYKILCNGRLC